MRNWDVLIVVAVCLLCVLVTGASVYWNYYTCTQKFPNVAWYVCVLSK